MEKSRSKETGRYRIGIGHREACGALSSRHHHRRGRSGEGLCLHLAFFPLQAGWRTPFANGAVRRGSRPGRRLASAVVAPSPRAERRHARFGPRPRLRFDIRSGVARRHPFRVFVPASAFPHMFEPCEGRCCQRLFNDDGLPILTLDPAFRHIFAMDLIVLSLRELKIAGGMEIRVR